RRRTATFPDRGLSIVGRAGQNCPGTCSVGQVGAIRSPLSGRVYVNVAVVVKDHEGSTNATASYAGNLTVIKRSAGSAAPNAARRRSSSGGGSASGARAASSPG